MRQSKQGVTTLYLHLNLTFSFITHQHQLRFLSNHHNRLSFYEIIKTRGNNPILTLKPNIFLCISSTSTPISFKPSWSGFHFMRWSKTRGNNPIRTLKPNIFPSYFININSDFFQTFITGFHFMRWSKQGVTTLYTLTLKSNIFLHNSSTSTLLWFLSNLL